ncbi:hypothetical protein QQP08_022830 [Theobroma cacao]|nr:hypothetical protein QQP08_022830 [Theobroma cacao]
MQTSEPQTNRRKRSQNVIVIPFACGDNFNMSTACFNLLGNKGTQQAEMIEETTLLPPLSL